MPNGLFSHVTADRKLMALTLVDRVSAIKEETHPEARALWLAKAYLRRTNFRDATMDRTALAMAMIWSQDIERRLENVGLSTRARARLILMGVALQRKAFRLKCVRERRFNWRDNALDCVLDRGGEMFDFPPDTTAGDLKAVAEGRFDRISTEALALAMNAEIMNALSGGNAGVERDLEECEKPQGSGWLSQLFGRGPSLNAANNNGIFGQVIAR